MSITHKFNARCDDLYKFIHESDTKSELDQDMYSWLGYIKRQYNNGRLSKDKEIRIKSIVANIFVHSIDDAVYLEIVKTQLNKIDNIIEEHGIAGVQDLAEIYRDSLLGNQRSKNIWDNILYTIYKNKIDIRLDNILNGIMHYTCKKCFVSIQDGSILLAKSICKDADLVINVAYGIDRFWEQLRDYLGEGKGDVIYKRYYIGLSYSDIARQLGVSRALISNRAITAIKELSTDNMISALSGRHIEMLPSLLFGQAKLNRILNTKYADSMHDIISVIKKRFNITQESDEYILGKLYLALRLDTNELDSIISELREESKETGIGYDSIFNQGREIMNYTDNIKAEKKFIQRLAVLSCEYRPDIDLGILGMPRSIEKQFRKIGINTVSNLVQYVTEYKGKSKEGIYKAVLYVNRKIMNQQTDNADNIDGLNISDALYNKLRENGIDTVDKLAEAIENDKIYSIKGIGKHKVDILIAAIS